MEYKTIYHALQVGETDRAIKIEWKDGKDVIVGWLPKSQIQTWPHQSAPCRLKIKMPEWLFDKKIEEYEDSPVVYNEMDLGPYVEPEQVHPRAIKIDRMNLEIFCYVDKFISGGVRKWTRDCAKVSGFNLIIK
jgi:hypothetical protein